MGLHNLNSFLYKKLRFGFFVICLLVIAGILTAFEPGPEGPSPAISADGVEIHFQVHGSGAHSLVFVHGWACDQSYWEQQIQHFSMHYKVVTIDLAGHGNSGVERDGWTMAAFGEDVTAVVEKLDLDSVILIGHSMGGPVIVEAAKNMPDRVTGLVGVDTFHDFDRESTSDEADALLQPLRENFAETTEAYVRANMFMEASDPYMKGQISRDMASATPEIAIPAIRNLLLRKDSQGLSEIQVPFTLINSDMQATNLKATERYGVEVLLMSDVGHFVMIEDPDTFNRLLTEVIEEFTANPDY